jgi:hypothetical protein
LGGELYNELRKSFPSTWGSLEASTMRNFEENFEKEMQHLFDTSDVVSLMKDIARYFCAFQPFNNSNLFIRFIHGLKDTIQDITFSTINYDLLFELALQSIGMTVQCFSETDIGVPFLKLHGSCNFVMRGVRFYGGSKKGKNLVNCPLDAVSREKALSYLNSCQTAYPAMCIYMESKPAQFGTGEIKKIQYRWKECVMRADRILIIGVKPNIADKHIWGPLSETNAKLGYIGSKDEFNNWRKTYRNNDKDVFIGSRWKEYLVDGIKFLKD